MKNDLFIMRYMVSRNENDYPFDTQLVLCFIKINMFQNFFNANFTIQYFFCSLFLVNNLIFAGCKKQSFVLIKNRP